MIPSVTFIYIPARGRRAERIEPIKAAVDAGYRLERSTHQLNSPIGLHLKAGEVHPGGALKLEPSGAHYKDISGGFC